MSELRDILIGTSIFSYFFTVKNYSDLARVTRIVLVFFAVTAVMTIITSIIDPMYARNITAAESIQNESTKELVYSMKIYGGGGYGTAITFMSLIPCIIYILKYHSFKYKRIMLLSYLILIVLSLIGMQFFANILIGIVILIFSLLGKKKFKASIILSLVFLVLASVIPQKSYSSLFSNISEIFTSKKQLQYKFEDMALFLKDDNGRATQVDHRLSRYPLLFESFIKNPMFGTYSNDLIMINARNISMGGHLFWMFKLTTNGILLFFIFLLMILKSIKNQLILFDQKFRFYFLLSSLSILLYGFIKNLVGREPWYFFFIVIPGIYYLPLLKKSKHE